MPLPYRAGAMIAFGILVGDRRQGRVLLWVMVGLWLASVLVASYAEVAGSRAVTDADGVVIHSKNKTRYRVNVAAGQAVEDVFVVRRF